MLAVSSLAILVLAFRLTPAAAGHGTHTQLGFHQCPWVGVFGKPCMTCGMTTAFSHAAHGDLVGAFRVQPFGALLALASAVGFWLGMHALWTGSRAVVACEPLIRPRSLWVLAALAGAAWAYKWAVWVNP